MFCNAFGDSCEVSVVAEFRKSIGDGRVRSMGPERADARESILIFRPLSHSISGERHGAWRFTGASPDGRRSYALQFGPSKNWADYVSLSYDDQKLEGHTRGSKEITYIRP